jgi:sulfur relay (sulfurtransferase) complex TusBCD TusD component (DsrE family)
MNKIKVAAAAMLLAVSFASLAVAGDKDPLFVNATSDDAHRAQMALSFSKNQLERQHPVTIFLNDRAVFVASKANAGRFEKQQSLLSTLMEKGATILVCGTCLKHYGIAEADLLPGINVSNPDLVETALFKDGTRTLSW